MHCVSVGSDDATGAHSGSAALRDKMLAQLHHTIFLPLRQPGLPNAVEAADHERPTCVGTRKFAHKFDVHLNDDCYVR
jgi:hypothetical protein